MADRDLHFDFVCANGQTARGMNSELKFHILDDKKMKRHNFADNGDKWCLFKRVGNPKYGISFDLIIPKENTELAHIAVIDEDFGQHYDYQHILRESPNCIPALRVWIDVEEIMEWLAEIGVVEGHKFGEYI
jgi:hypothetical protein